MVWKSGRKEDGMKNLGKYAGVLALIAFSAALMVLSPFASSQSKTEEPVPAFHAEPPAGELPPTMEPSIYSDKLVFNAYVVAGRSKKVLYQQPCYCHCDRGHGHGSLLDCFVGRHGSGCDICQKEAFYAYEQTRKGKTPKQIRESIMRGDWQKVELAKYEKDYLPPLNTPAK
jgi:hypothetical protein